MRELESFEQYSLRTNNTPAPTPMPAKQVFEQKSVPVVPEPTTNIIQIPNGSALKDGVFQSPNFAKGFKGWRIDSDGNVEFNDGVFRGTFSIGGTVITIDNTKNIQEHIDQLETAGGGILYLQNGTYVLPADISIPGGVTIVGTSRDDVIIDCNADYSVIITGLDAYNTGTVAIANGDTEVVGTGTSWTSAMVGQYIQLDRIWYEVTAVTDSTHLTIASDYQNSDLSGDSYTIATVNFNAGLTDVTVTNATGSGIFSQYAMECILDNLVIYGCGIGVDIRQTVYPRMLISSLENDTNLRMEDVGGFYIDFSLFANSLVGAGVQMINSGDATFFNSSVSSNTGDGISVTGCDRIAFISITVNQNGGDGVEFVSGNEYCQLTDMVIDANTGDGVKMTATTDSIITKGISMTNNGGYGMNIAASTCDNNIISSNSFAGNTTAAMNDGGTGTIIRGNSGVVDNNTVDLQTFTADGTWNKPDFGSIAFIQVWGGGGSGGKGITGDEPGGGGGGGAYSEKWLLLSTLGATESVTVGAGGVAVTATSTNGNAGGNSSFGSWLSAYGGGGGGRGGTSGYRGGGGGGGSTGAGATPSVNTTGGAGGTPSSGAGGTAGNNGGSAEFGGGGGGFGDATPTAGGGASYGGGGGGGCDTSSGAGGNTTGLGGDSLNGGGGGGGGAIDTVAAAGGSSIGAGDGGAGAHGSNNATAGSIPSGGGGGSQAGTSGAGARGQVIVSVF